MIKTFLKSQITRHIAPVRRVVEENHRLNSDNQRLYSVTRQLESELETNRIEIIRLKRLLNIIGEPHKLFGSYAEALAECTTPEGYDSTFLSRYRVEKSLVYLKQL